MHRELNLLIIGAGQYGHVVKEIAESLEIYEKIDFLDDHSNIAIGKIGDMKHYVEEYRNAIVAIGNPEVKSKVMGQLRCCQYEIVSLIHPRATISKSSKIGEGCVIEAGAVINTDVQLADGVIVSAGAVVNHNSTVGAYTHIDCNSVVESGCIVPANIKIHCGMVYTRDV